MLEIGIVILTSDFRLAYKVQSLLAGRYSRLVHSVNPSDVKTSDIVITTHGEFLEINFPRVLRFSGHRSVTLTSLLSGINSFFTQPTGLCLVGIDPGKTVGVGLIFNGSVLATRTFSDFRALVIWLRGELSLLAFEELIFRIGDGGDKYHEPLVDLLFKEFGHLGSFELVNETRTSVRVGSRSLHEEAALRIARRYGIRIEDC